MTGRPGISPLRTRRCQPSATWSNGAMSSFLLAAFSLSWLFIAGLGALPALLLAGKPRQENDGLHLLAAAWSFGLSLNYALLLVVGHLTAVLGVGVLI